MDQRDKYNFMEGAITTADSKADGRLKAGVSVRSKKRDILRRVMDGKGGPSLSSFKPIGYGKVSFPKIKISTSSSLAGKGTKKFKASAFKAALKGAMGKKPSISKFRVSKLSKGIAPKIKTVKLKKMAKFKQLRGMVKANK